MRKDGKYRFTLQFPAETEAQITVGELLEKLGNRKSAIVVEAVSAYIQAHPELLSGKRKITIRMERGINREQVEALIRKILEEHLGVGRSTAKEQTTPIDTGRLDDDISRMLDNLVFFS